MLAGIARNENIVDSTYFTGLRIQISSSEDILTPTSSPRRNSLSSGILNLVNFSAGGLINWENIGRLSFNSNLEDHHIFPIQFLQDKYKGDFVAQNSSSNRSPLRLTKIAYSLKSGLTYTKLCSPVSAGGAGTMWP